MTALSKSFPDSIVAALCLTCGARDDHRADGYCKNGHDDWLELWDVEQQNSFFKRALRQSGLTAEELKSRFMDGKSFKW